MTKLPYFDMEQAEKELILKLILCTVFSFLFTWMIDDPYCTTTAITANLYLYTDRGYHGGNLYAIRRIAVQLLQGIFMMLIILPCKYFLPFSIPDTIIIIAAVIFALLLGMPINYRYQYSPLNCSIANASFILACSMIRDFDTYPYRVFHCVIGCIIGYLVNHVLVPERDRYQETMHLIQEYLEDVCRETIDKKKKMRIETNIRLIGEDNKRGLKRHKRTADEIQLVRLSGRIVGICEAYQIQRREMGSQIQKFRLERFDQVFWQNTQYLLERFYALKKSMEYKDMADTKISDMQMPEEILLVSCLVEYCHVIKKIDQIIKHVACEETGGAYEYFSLCKTGSGYHGNQD